MYIFTHIHIHAFICLYMYLYKYGHINSYIFIYIHMYVYNVYIYIYLAYVTSIFIYNIGQKTSRYTHDICTNTNPEKYANTHHSGCGILSAPKIAGPKKATANPTRRRKKRKMKSRQQSQRVNVIGT